MTAEMGFWGSAPDWLQGEPSRVKRRASRAWVIGAYRSDRRLFVSFDFL